MVTPPPITCWVMRDIILLSMESQRKCKKKKKKKDCTWRQYVVGKCVKGLNCGYFSCVRVATGA